MYITLSFLLTSVHLKPSFSLAFVFRRMPLPTESAWTLEALTLVWRKRDQKHKNILLIFIPRKRYGYSFLQGWELPIAQRLLAVSWIWNESSAGFFHIHDFFWHGTQLCKSSAAKFCFAIPQAVHLLLITTIIYIELESFTSRLRPS